MKYEALARILAADILGHEPEEALVQSLAKRMETMEMTLGTPLFEGRRLPYRPSPYEDRPNSEKVQAFDVAECIFHHSDGSCSVIPGARIMCVGLCYYARRRE